MHSYMVDLSQPWPFNEHTASSTSGSGLSFELNTGGWEFWISDNISVDAEISPPHSYWAK